ncbi:hypothetical protein C1I92_20075 [Jiangella anatolica]|uniref:Uncharacterized protein n=1 Tax=Jiangella anatolica TaxID=2670374 RepID=A0A2W2CN68_9ACTN|nr:hypothetical protein C1I92_20075 [Jiangella anatolica]
MEEFLRESMKAEVQALPMPPGLAAAARRRLRRRRATAVGASVVAASVAIGLGVATTIGGETPEPVATAPAETHPLPDSGWPGSGLAGQARIEGVLAATEDGCFYLELDDGLHPVSLLWPQGWSWSERPDGTLVVLTDRGYPVLSPGDRIEFGGGFTTNEPDEPDPCGVGARGAAPMNSVPRKLP